MKNIHENITLVRIEELKIHLSRMQKHESMGVQTMKEIIKMTEETRKVLDNIILKLAEFKTGLFTEYLFYRKFFILETPKSTKYIIKFVSAKKEKELLKYREEMDAEYDAILDQLNKNYHGFVNERTRKCRKYDTR